MLHLMNNLERPNACTDKFYKVKPIMDAVLKRCKELEIGQNISIDEQMIPFTGKINMFPNGLAHNFIPYQGSTTEINRDNVKKYGQSSAIVLELLEIAKKEGHTVYFDNYFNSYALLLRLLELKMYAAGTVRMNRFYKPHFISDKDIKKKKRGYSEDLVSQDGIIMVKWLGNKPVHMASNFVGTGTIDKAKRWDKQKSAYIEIDRPEVVRQYNSNMGGVDLLDIWIEYKQDCIEAKIHKKDIMDLLELRMHVSKSLIYKNKLVNVKKRGRPSKSEGEITPDRKRKFRCCEKRPIREIQHDNVDHMPQIDDKKEATRCKMPLCKGRTHFYCDKCRVHLCLVKERNCFERFHRK
ncbi:piggyBac transposable element-derived protein 3-like [Colletes gigas]|uniref:piggyBac transposable element-derived protein 3-like n=1 Tax=Colletes gigas TaxID=935657 RepID=UPI001C9B2EF4|nr:piggyBac transposable element-derived protein 3-like [Colletes gigas]